MRRLGYYLQKIFAGVLQQFAKLYFKLASGLQMIEQDNQINIVDTRLRI